jgi:hypothetical protein
MLRQSHRCFPSAANVVIKFFFLFVPTAIAINHRLLRAAGPNPFFVSRLKRKVHSIVSNNSHYAFKNCLPRDYWVVRRYHLVAWLLEDHRNAFPASVVPIIKHINHLRRKNSSVWLDAFTKRLLIIQTHVTHTSRKTIQRSRTWHNDGDTESDRTSRH